MCALLAIVQYEVQYFQDGRWLVQSRYPGDQRQDAINDATVTEAQTRRPTKVIKDTYLPMENRSETVTVYIGPLLKAAMEKAKAPPPVSRGALYTPTRATRNGPERGSAPHTKMRARSSVSGISVGDLFSRALIAMGLSLAAATVVTLMVSWLMRHLPDLGINITAESESAILTFTYVGVFLLGVMSLFRFGAPIKRLLSQLWNKTAEKPTDNQAVTRATIAGFKFRKKHRSQIPFEHAQETLDMRRLRGDHDATAQKAASSETVDSPDMPTVESTAASVPTPPEPVVAQMSVPPVEAPVSLDPPSVDATSFEQGAPTPAPAVAQTMSATPVLLPSTKQQAQAFDPAINDLQRGLALRFVAEVVLPQLARDNDDPVARRGAALFLTGAIRHLAATSGMDETLTQNLIAGSVKAALPPHAYDAFMSHFVEHADSPANAELIADGHGAMAKFLAGQRDPVAVNNSLQAWRIHLPTLPTPDAVASGRGAPPSEFYVMTELRGGDAYAMEIHNQAVRQAVESNDGVEIKHTGRGILARFAYADFAIQSALNISTRLSHEALEPNVAFAVAIVPGFGPADDPILSPKVAKQAQGLLERAPAGGVVCDQTVLAQAHAKTRYVGQTLTPTAQLIREKPPVGLTEAIA